MKNFALWGLAAIGLTAAGCGEARNTRKSEAASAVATRTSGDSHASWWCGEHGLPEEQCSMCSVTAPAEFKMKGDWCTEHDRAESQCFLCHPELEEKFAAQYEAKFGKKPPEREREDAEEPQT